MDSDVSSGDIARIEERIEELTQAIARCRKVSLASKLAIAAGAAWIVLTLLWLVPYVPTMVLAALAAAIGGIVLLGSNATTWTQTEEALAASEAMRAEWIGQREMRVVGASAPRLH
jgi:membrane glycosyltransferase